MKRLFMYFLIAVAVPVIAVADGDTTPALVNPLASGLTVKSVSNGPDSGVLFSGQTWVSGTFRAEWHQNFAIHKPAYVIALAIKPDDAEYGRLPHFGSDKADFIWIGNEHWDVQAIFGKKLATKFLNRQVQVLEVHGRFLIKDYSAGECGSPWASAGLVSAEVSQPATIGSGLEIGDC